MYEVIEKIFETLVEYCILILGIVGVVIILVSAARALIALFRRQGHPVLHMLHGISLALGFLLGSEVLHTVIAHDFQSILTTGIIMAVRAAITVLIHWEVKHEAATVQDEKDGQ